MRPDRIWALDARATEERAFQTGRDSLASRLGALAAPFAAEHEVAPVIELRPAGSRGSKRRSAGLTSRPVAAALELQGTEVVVQPGTPGTTVAVEPLLDSLRAAALAGTGEIVAAVEPVQPGIHDRGGGGGGSASASDRRCAGFPFASTAGTWARSSRAGSPASPVFARAAGACGSRSAWRPRARAAPDGQGSVRLQAPVGATFKVVGDRVRVVRSRPGTTLAPIRAGGRVGRGALANVRPPPSRSTRSPGGVHDERRQGDGDPRRSRPSRPTWASRRRTASGTCTCSVTT